MGGLFDIESLSKKLEDLRKETLQPSFYDDIKKSSEINMEITALDKKISYFKELEKEIDADLELFELVSDEEINNLVNKVEDYELETFLNGKYDNLNCFLEIHSGAGGTEACDWCSMLLRMYERFCEKNGFKYEEISAQEGDEAGFKSVFIKINGYNAYGYLKNESGVHRLVRISPFDSNSRRHTSFASVNVTPEFKKIDNIEIDEKDLKIDVFHSSGAGGQSVNTANSAVRITHLPTKIVVSVQNERSQLRNKEIAMEILKSKLYQIELEKQESKISGLKNNDSINFGSQIRSYILEPYKLVKDNRSDYESNSPDKILDGDIKEMLEYNLKNI